MKILKIMKHQNIKKIYQEAKNTSSTNVIIFFQQITIKLNIKR